MTIVGEVETVSEASSSDGSLYKEDGGNRDGRTDSPTDVQLGHHMHTMTVSSHEVEEEEDHISAARRRQRQNLAAFNSRMHKLTGQSTSLTDNNARDQFQKSHSSTALLGQRKPASISSNKTSSWELKEESPPSWSHAEARSQFHKSSSLSVLNPSRTHGGSNKDKSAKAPVDLTQDDSTAGSNDPSAALQEENLEYREKCLELQEQVSKLKKQLLQSEATNEKLQGQLVGTKQRLRLNSGDEADPSAEGLFCKEAACSQARDAEFLSITIMGKKQGERIGVRMVEMPETGIIKIDDINPVGLIAKSPLGAGDVLLSVNGVRCAGMGVGDVTGMIAEATGNVTLVAHTMNANAKLHEFMVQEDLVATKQKCSELQKDYDNLVDELANEKRVFSSSLAAAEATKGLLQREIEWKQKELIASELTLQQLKQKFDCEILGEIVSELVETKENNEKLHQELKQAHHALVGTKHPQQQCQPQQCQPQLPSSQQSPNGEKSQLPADGRSEFLTVAVVGKAAGARLGVRLVELDDGHLQIADIVPEGMLATSPLCAGDLLISVNGNTCQGRGVSPVVAEIGRASGTLTLVAQNKDIVDQKKREMTLLEKEASKGDWDAARSLDGVLFEIESSPRKERKVEDEVDEDVQGFPEFPDPAAPNQ